MFDLNDLRSISRSTKGLKARFVRFANLRPTRSESPHPTLAAPLQPLLTLQNSDQLRVQLGRRRRRDADV